MKIKIIAVGKSMPKWVDQGWQTYVKRLPAHFKLSLIEIPLQKRAKNADLARLRALESQRMLQHIHTNDHVIALDVLGKAWSTERLARELESWSQHGQDCCLLIGGPEGLSAECLARANQHWSLSALTFPHPLVRVIVAEQLYRAWSLNTGHPYHR